MTVMSLEWRLRMGVCQLAQLGQDLETIFETIGFRRGPKENTKISD
jgi:hypothetical protein